ncbi:MAG TPA: penicillin-binding protein 2 [Planctomycetaceae bacterium]|nr:penicillin-binding protein 2 [Planctomycetaceae bacterium]
MRVSLVAKPTQPDQRAGVDRPLPSRSDAAMRGRRQWIVVAVLFSIGLALTARLIQLQVFEAARLAERANRQRSYADVLPAPPGDLLDRDGRVLATTVKAHSLFLIPQDVFDRWPVSLSLAGALKLDADRIYERLVEQRDKKFLWIKRRLTPAEEEAVEKLKLPVGTWGFRDEYLRRYPQGALAAHVLGLRDIDGKGRGGLEESLDAMLRGQEGRRTLIRDARGRVIDVADEEAVPPRRGADVRTTLDAVVQTYVERELDRLIAEWKPRGACAVVQDPVTGEILAMASRPTFDPNDPESVSPAVWKNRAVAWMYEPGSTFKPFVVAGALQRGLLNRDDEIDCGNGETRLGSRLLHDTHPYGRLSVTDVLVKSSNIGMSQIGARLSNEQLHATILSFGFGRPTGSGLPGEMPGMLRPFKDWSSYSSASLSIGQELAVTPLQMICAHSALANGGTWISPKLVLSATRGPLERSQWARTGGQGVSAVPALDGGLPSSIVSKATDRSAARWLVEQPMTEVVRRGTGTRAQLTGYAVFGKTGTAQKLDSATGTYSTTKYVGSFLCGAPAADPRVLVLVVVDEPATNGSHYGGTVAAPAAAEILHQTLIHLRVAPDDVRNASAAR